MTVSERVLAYSCQNSTTKVGTRWADVLNSIKPWLRPQIGLVLSGVEGDESVEPFAIDRSDYGNMDDWLPVGDINSVKIA